MDIALGLAAAALLILANAFFVAAEFALVAVDRERVEVLAAVGGRRARRAAAALGRLSFNLSGAQLGITVTSLVLGFVAEPTIARAIRPMLGALPEGNRTATSIALALLIATVVQMVMGELIPKGLAIAHPLPTSLALAGPLRAYTAVFGPLIRFLNGAADATVRRIGIEPRDELRSVRSLEEIELLIRSSGEEGTLDADAANLLARTIRFGQMNAAGALVPRVDMVTLPVEATVADLSRQAVETGHSRFPVEGADRDDIVGVAHAKDVLLVPAAQRATTPVTAVSRPPLFIPEGRDLESLLTEMRAEGIPLAVVLDEYGGVAGILTLEDLLEEIVGEIADEHDPPEPSLTSSLPTGTTVVDGSLHLDEVAAVTGLVLPAGPYETVAGFVLDRLGHLPVPGERVDHEGWELEVLELERRRIASLRVAAPSPARPPGDDGLDRGRR
ncbi:MAG TPA: hemolysin family protein [Acidimicrobiales bacterium]|nr:hemolysin family protein [Acidimicrobiales bacterium]